MITSLALSNDVKQQLLVHIYEQLEDAIFILDANLHYISVNSAYETMIGYDKKFLIGRPLGIYAAEFLLEDERTILQDISKHLDDDGFYENNFAMTSRYAQIINCKVTFQRIGVDNETFYIGIICDISSATKDRQRVTNLLNYDQLTGLPNRKVFLSQSSDLIMESFQEVVIIRANIDRYRILISNFGQDKVDALIKEFVERVDNLDLKNLQCFSHFGGDDFGLLFEFCDAHLVRHQLDSLMQLCELPFTVDTHSVFLHISVGVSYYPKNGKQLNHLLNKAEKALHYVKQQGGDDICWYSDDLNNITLDNLQLESELREAIKTHQFEPYYQSKVALETGDVVGFEALVRWRHPTRGLLDPKYFMDAIIKYKLSFDLFCQMAIQIAKQLLHWRQLGFSQYVCVNADAAEFSHPNFLSFVSQLFDQYDIEPHKLNIEVTESSLMLRHASVKQQIVSLKELGVSLALDDFGTGYASLSYLQEYPFDFIKIDKSFISDITSNPTQRAIVKTILDLSVALNMVGVAEGIETEEQRDLLLQMGCQYGQGYWFNRPVSADKATKILTQ
ncbi:putative bifunctional diguanylate cyclase/phosphodiesterase [uncultured Psychrobacter sp.]|uniref:putative bifunctional diguanylate cyclase/phosphodiesterase n=1 Tax=uncultured Psychrobacter sp. TaxID=259303 RepID=UPI00345A18A9